MTCLFVCPIQVLQTVVNKLSDEMDDLNFEQVSVIISLVVSINTELHTNITLRVKERKT